MSYTEPTDYYVGRGAGAEYVGTALTATSPPEPRVFQSLRAEEYTESHFRGTAAVMIDSDVWPHRHSDSTETKWTYCYDKGSVYVYLFGVEMLVVRCNAYRTIRRGAGTDGTRRVWRPVNDFPEMDNTEAVTP